MVLRTPKTTKMTKMAGVTQAKPWFTKSGVFTTPTNSRCDFSAIFLRLLRHSVRFGTLRCESAAIFLRSRFFGRLSWRGSGPACPYLFRVLGLLCSLLYSYVSSACQESQIPRIRKRSERVKWGMGWVVVGTAVFGAPRFLAKTL